MGVALIIIEIKGKQNILYYNQKAYQFYLKHRYQKNWLSKLQQTNLFLEAKIYLVDLNIIRNDGTLICDFCHSEITINNPSYSNCIIHYVYRIKNPKQIFSPDLNMLIHKSCLDKILKLNYQKEVRKSW